MSRRLAREKAMQCIFSITVGNTQIENALEILDEEQLSTQDKDFAKNIIYGVINNLSNLDKLYVPFLKDWQLERLANIDKTLLRMAVFEMKNNKDIPHSVTINEAVELAKIFGTEDSPKFINAVLDNVKKLISKEQEEANVSRD